jgi:hypothetical protein
MFATRNRFEELKDLGEANVKVQVVNSIATVINNYYNIVRQKQQLKVIDTLITINEERVKLADKKIICWTWQQTGIAPGKGGSECPACRENAAGNFDRAVTRAS